MPKPIDINIYQIAKTKIDHAAVHHWLHRIGVSDPAQFMSDAHMGCETDPALLVALAAKRCYKSFEPGLNPNVTQIRSDYNAYFNNILSSGHGSVLEHAVYSFAFEGVSRVFTGEMNRHRAGWAISEGSMRFIRFNNIEFWMPTSLEPNALDDPTLAERKARSRAVFMAAFKSQELFYNQLVEIWDLDEKDKNFAYKKRVTSCLRRIIGMGVATGGVWTGNVRALRHVLTMRGSEAAEEEILHVFSRVARMMAEDEPLLFGDFYQDPMGYWRPKYVKV